MALVRELVTSNGVHVEIHDDCYAGVSAEELERRKRHMYETIARVDRNIQLREIKAKQEAEKQNVRIEG